jgi:hypothetical protein
MVDEKNIILQYEPTQPGRKKLQTSNYEKIESVLLEWIKQKQALNTPIQGSVWGQ